MMFAMFMLLLLLLRFVLVVCGRAVVWCGGGARERERERDRVYRAHTRRALDTALASSHCNE